MNFTTALAILLKEEGGYVNNPRDPGGMTNLGVTRRVWEEWTGKSASETVMRALTQVAVAPLYKSRYWDKVLGDDLPAALSLAVFDFAVNAGPGRAVKLLQGIAGATKDGVAGKGTLAAVQAYAGCVGLEKLIQAYCGARRDYYHALPTFAHFGRGWMARVDRIEAACLKAAL